MTRRPPAPTRFLMLSFRLPENPSRYRVSVWRRLKRAGARPVHRALFSLPDTPLNRLRALDIAHDVETWGGAVWLFLGQAMPRVAHSAPKLPESSGRVRAVRPSGR
jgi:hypothetical protein